MVMVNKDDVDVTTPADASRPVFRDIDNPSPEHNSSLRNDEYEHEDNRPEQTSEEENGDEYPSNLQVFVPDGDLLIRDDRSIMM